MSKINSIKVKQLSKIFETKNGGFEALSEVNLEVKKGNFVSIIGPSGCGKTTLMRCLSNLEDTSNGSIEINGKTPDVARKDRDFGMVFQSSGLLSWRNSIDNVMLPVELSGENTNSYKNKVTELLGLVNLLGFEKSYPHELSGGMQQRVSIARSLILEPKILFMDEPFGALDEIVRDHLNEQLLELWRKTEKTVVFVTHSIPEAVFLSTHIVVMSPRPGKIFDIIKSPLPSKRDLSIRETPEFLKIAQRVREGLRAGHSYDD